MSISASDPLPQLWEVIRELGNTSGITVAVAAVALAVLLLLHYVMPRLPAALLVVVAAIGVSWALDLQAHGVAVVGAIPSGLPSFGVPWPAGPISGTWPLRRWASSLSRSRTRS